MTIASSRLLLVFVWCNVLLTCAGLDMCTFSCPETDLTGNTLMVWPGAVPYDSVYSIFECFYSIKSQSQSAEPHLCSYYKTTGLQAMGSVVDSCRHEAIPCSDSSSPPLFSADGKDVETPPWIVIGKDLLWMKEHHT